MKSRFSIFSLGIWFFAFGYFACYVPFSALTKALASGLLPGMEEPLRGFKLLPGSVMASAIAMVLFLYLSGWYKAAHQFKIGKFSIPHPTKYTLVSGSLTSLIIVTTVLAYTFEGISIVFVMLLMRGGVLIAAPIIDAISKREVRWFSWAGLILSLMALIVVYSEKGGFALNTFCVVNIFIYLMSYFFRLNFMSRFAKSRVEHSNKRYFVEEQLIAAPLLVLGLFVFALFGTGNIASEVSYGFFEIWSHPMLHMVILSGILSQGVGVFGGLVLLDKSENTYSVPVNRCSSILAGVFASLSLWLIYDKTPPSIYQFVGASLIIMAVLFLTIPKALEKMKRVPQAA